MNKTHIGSVSEAQILAALVRLGKRVLVPYGDHLRYDLALDEDGALKRIQVKTGRLRNGVVVFLTASKATNKQHGGRWQGYGDIDYFGVYCRQNNTSYLVPAQNASKGTCCLRIDQPTRSRKDIRWAKEFEI